MLQYQTIIKKISPELSPALLPCNFRMQITLSDSFTSNNIGAFLLLTAIVFALTVALASLSSKRFKVALSKTPGNALLNPVPITTAALILGMGLGGFFDGIVFHQILQWHSMLSNSIPQLTTEAVHISMLWDGLFHFLMLLVVGIGIVSLLKLISRTDVDFSARLFSGGILAGWGIFNLLEGAINHYIFRLHNVRENTEQADLYNAVFMVVSLVILFSGAYLLKTTLAKSAHASFETNTKAFL